MNVIRRRLLPLCVTGLILCTVPAAAGEFAIGDDSVLPDGAVLVAARVKATVEHGQLSAALLEITHVYAGEKRTDDIAFFVSTFGEGRSHGGSWRIPALQEGEQVIWTIRHVDFGESEDGTALVAAGLAPGVELPGRANRPYTRFSEVRRCAEAVQEVWRLKPRQRLPRLMELSRSDCPEVASWALHTIARSEFPGRADFLRELVRDSRVPIEATAVADEELWYIGKADWASSEPRLDLFRRWVFSNNPNPRQLRYCMGRLSMAADTGEIAPAALRALAIGAMDNPTWSETAQERMLVTVRDAMCRGGEQREAPLFAVLSDLMLLADRPPLREAAAAHLVSAPMSECRLKLAQRLLPAVRDDKLHAIMQEGVEKAVNARQNAAANR